MELFNPLKFSYQIQKVNQLNSHDLNCQNDFIYPNKHAIILSI